MFKNEFDLNIDHLPSVEDYINSSDHFPSIEKINHNALPSIDEFIIEDVVPEQETIDEDLPSIHEFLEVEVEKDVQEISEEISEEIFEEETENSLTLEELVLMIENVRDNIPEIPEIRYYEDPLLELSERINLIPEVKYYDNEIDELKENLKNIKNSIPKVPEWINEEFYSSISESVLNFENNINFILDRLDVIDFHNKVDNNNFKEKIEEYNKFKKIIDDNIEVLNDDLISLKESLKISEEKILEKISEIPKIPEVKYYDIEIKDLKESISSLNEKVLDIKIPEIPELPKFPEVKYYDEDIKNLYNDIKNLTERIKLNETKLEESQTIKEEVNEDPLTNTNFATIDDLKNHYNLFINRIQQQLASIGGGGETQLKYLDDVVGIATNPSAYDNRFLKYNHSIGKFEFASVGAGSQNLDDTLQLGNTSSLGMSVGVTTVISLNIDTVAHFDTDTITISSSSPTQIYSFSASQYRSARIQIQITQGSDYQTSDVLVIHNGTNANLVEYASISTNDYLGTFDAVISSGNVSLQVLMSSASTATIKTVSQVIRL